MSEPPKYKVIYLFMLWEHTIYHLHISNLGEINIYRVNYASMYTFGINIEMYSEG